MDHTSQIVENASKIDGWMQYEELQWLAQKASQKKVIIEIGCWQGRSTKALTASSGVIYAIDPWNLHKKVEKTMHYSPNQLYEIFCSNLKAEIQACQVIPIRAPSQEAVEVLKKQDVLADMIFIDGDHSYQGVKDDINNYFPFLAPGGLLCGHDYYSEEGVVRAVNEFIGYRQTYVTQNNQIWFWDKK